MLKKLALGGVALLALLAVGGLSGMRTAPDRASAVVTDPIQDFDIDIVICMAHNYGTTPDPTSPAPGFPKGSCSGEDLTLGSSTDESVSIFLGAGQRIGLPYIYHGPGWRMATDAEITDDITQVGDVKSQIDLGCDGIPDIMADGGNTPPISLASAAPEQYMERTVAFGPAESYLDKTLPGSALATKRIRWRADITTIFLVNGTIAFPLPSTSPLNTTTLDLVFGGSSITGTTLAGNPGAPSTTLLCLQAGQESVSNTYGNAGPFLVRGNPMPAGVDVNSDGVDDAAGIYAIWATEVSSQDVRTGDISFVLVTDCKVVGPGTHTDADSDCLESSATAQPGRPSESPADDANPDRDGDGLPDGIEVAWGSNPAAADTDGDGRTDLEEMLGPTQFLSNPLVPDTDSDGFVDGGLRADCNKDGVPDDMTVNNAGGRIRVRVNVCHTPSPSGDDVQNKTQFGPRGARVTGNTKTGFPVAPAVGDNCPSIPNPGQEDLSLLPLAKDRLPSDDVTNPHKSWYGDACNNDIDGDGLNDLAEAHFVYDPGTASIPPSCHMDGADDDADGVGTFNGTWTPADAHSGAIAVTPLTVETTVGGVRTAVPDTDYDGTLDGVECELLSVQAGKPNGASNPASASIKPAACSSVGGTDGDSDGLCLSPQNTETYFRTQSINTTSGLTDNPDEDAKSPGDSDADSDNDGIGDGVEAKGWNGTSSSNTPAASSKDADVDGCSDAAQIGSIDGNRQVSSADALTIVKAAANLLSGVTLPLHSQEKHILDIDRNGTVNTSDAVVVAKLPVITCDIYW